MIRTKKPQVLKFCSSPMCHGLNVIVLQIERTPTKSPSLLVFVLTFSLIAMVDNGFNVLWDVSTGSRSFKFLTPCRRQWCVIFFRRRSNPISKRWLTEGFLWENRALSVSSFSKTLWFTVSRSSECSSSRSLCLSGGSGFSNHYF